MYHGSSTVNVHVKDNGFITVIRTRTFRTSTGEFHCRVDHPFESDEVQQQAELGTILNYFGHHYGRNTTEDAGDGWTCYSFKRVVESGDSVEA
jgi:hypothetical protein